MVARRGRSGRRVELKRSPLGRRLVHEFVMSGTASRLQATAAATIEEFGRGSPTINVLASIGADGKYPNNMLRDLMRMNWGHEAVLDLPELYWAPIDVYATSCGERNIVQRMHPFILTSDIVKSVYQHKSLFKALLLGEPGVMKEYWASEGDRCADWQHGRVAEGLTENVSRTLCMGTTHTSRAA